MERRASESAKSAMKASATREKASQNGPQCGNGDAHEGERAAPEPGQQQQPGGVAGTHRL